MVSSFQIDHTKLKPGVYLQGSIQNIDTYDIRIFEPSTINENGCPACLCGDGWSWQVREISAAFHTLEHVLAFYFRNVCDHSDEVVYIGPAGCLTCFYLVVTKSHFDWVKEISLALLWTERYLRVNSRVPGGTKVECGNPKHHNIPLAHKIVEIFINTDWAKEYPVIES